MSPVSSARPPRADLRAQFSLHVGVLQEEFLVRLVFAPTNIAGVMVAQEDRPFLFGLPNAADLVGASVDDLRSLRRPAEGICARVKRVVQDLHDGVIGWRLPDNLVNADVPAHDGHLDLGRTEPKENLTGAAEFAELREHHAHRFLHMFVGINLDPAGLAPTEPGRKHELELATPRLRVASRQTALAHQAEFVFRHRALQAEQQAVVDNSRIVSAFGIDDERPRQRAQFDQVMPVSSVARQPRGFNAIDGADIARAHHRHQPLEARAFDGSRSRPAKIVVDHRHRLEARAPARPGKVILPALALQIADNLRHGRLPHIDDRRTGEMISGDLGAHGRLPRWPRPPSSARRAPRAEGRPVFRSAPLCSGVAGNGVGGRGSRSSASCLRSWFLLLGTNCLLRFGRTPS